VTDDESFESFMAAALPALLRFGHVLTGDPHRAEELVQAALVKTYQRWARVDRATPQAYVRSAMVNTHTSWWRRGRREGSLPPGFDVASAASAVRDYDDRDLALRALQTLPSRQRAVLVLRYYEDLSEADIAATLGCSTGTVKSQASRALRTLRSRLDHPSPEGALR
jgi:RNA polymerase sigma-70 factor (sigma-E family)